MKYSAKITDPVKAEADILVVFGFSDGEDGVLFSEAAKRTDHALGGILGESARLEGFHPDTGNTFVVHTHGMIASRRVMLVGLGKKEALDAFGLQKAGAAIGRRAKASKAGVIAVTVLPEFGSGQVHQEVASLCVGIRLGSYRFMKHKDIKEQAKEKAIEEVLMLTTASKLNEVDLGISLGTAFADAVTFARDLVNEPPSVTTPTHLGEVAKSLAKGQKSVSAEVFGKSDLEDMGMGGLLGIARGSDEEPKFIKLTYRGGGPRTVAVIGKGITFDTGGLSLKPSEHMETMKLDMAGAATILGMFSVLPVLKPRINVVGLISATENMPSGKAIKPGDVVRAMNGKTIEVLNTDAEGRVVLSDALSYAVAKVKPDVMIDLATLTGACMVALGEEVAGLFANRQDLADALLSAAKASGEQVWQLPLVSEYKDALKSSVADLKNIGRGRYGGAITAALFLQEFVSENIPWAHLDIAGPAFAERDALLTPVGGTGFGVRMCLTYLLTLSE